jgi:hypothetical protein
VARAEPPKLDSHGPQDLRHTHATWLEDGAVPARVIDELMGHQAGRRAEREGSMIGTRYRHMTEAMQARVAAVIAERLAVALAFMPQVCPKRTHTLLYISAAQHADRMDATGCRVAL